MQQTKITKAQSVSRAPESCRNYYYYHYYISYENNNYFTLRNADIKIKLVTKITAATTNENNENNTNKFLTEIQKRFIKELGN